MACWWSKSRRLHTTKAPKPVRSPEARSKAGARIGCSSHADPLGLIEGSKRRTRPAENGHERTRSAKEETPGIAFRALELGRFSPG